jgi:hypothetical protein
LCVYMYGMCSSSYSTTHWRWVAILLMEDNGVLQLQLSPSWYIRWCGIVLELISNKNESSQPKF